MRSHTGDKPYACTQCDDRFARSDLLSRHVNKTHGPPDSNAAAKGDSKRGATGAGAGGRRKSKDVPQGEGGVGLLGSGQHQQYQQVQSQSQGLNQHQQSQQQRQQQQSAQIQQQQQHLHQQQQQQQQLLDSTGWQSMYPSLFLGQYDTSGIAGASTSTGTGTTASGSGDFSHTIQSSQHMNPAYLQAHTQSQSNANPNANYPSVLVQPHQPVHVPSAVPPSVLQPTQPVSSQMQHQHQHQQQQQQQLQQLQQLQQQQQLQQMQVQMQQLQAQETRWYQAQQSSADNTTLQLSAPNDSSLGMSPYTNLSPANDTVYETAAGSVSPAGSGATSSNGTVSIASPLSHGFSQQTSGAFYLPGQPGYDAAGWQSTTTLQDPAIISSPKIKKRACEQCNLSKVKCDFQTPCQKCQARNIQCSYPPLRQPSSKASSKSPTVQTNSTPALGGAPERYSASPVVQTSNQIPPNALSQSHGPSSTYIATDALMAIDDATLASHQQWLADVTLQNQQVLFDNLNLANQGENGLHIGFLSTGLQHSTHGQMESTSPQNQSNSRPHASKDGFAFPQTSTQMRASQEDDTTSVYSESGVSSTTKPSGEENDSRRPSLANSIILDDDPGLSANLGIADLNVNELGHLLPGVQQQFLQQDQQQQQQQVSHNVEPGEDLPTMVPGGMHPGDPESGLRVRQAWQAFISQSRAQAGFRLGDPAGRGAGSLQGRKNDKAVPEIPINKRPLLNRGRSNSLPSVNVQLTIQEALKDVLHQPSQAVIEGPAYASAQALNRDEPRSSTKGSSSVVENVSDESQSRTGPNRPQMSMLQPKADAWTKAQYFQQRGTTQTLAPERAPSFLLNSPSVERDYMVMDSIQKTTSAHTRPGNKRLASQTLVPNTGKRPSTLMTSEVIEEQMTPTQTTNDSTTSTLRRQPGPGWMGMSDLPLSEILASGAFAITPGGGPGMANNHNATSNPGMESSLSFPGLTPIFDPYNHNTNPYAFDLITSTPSSNSAFKGSFV